MTPRRSGLGSLSRGRVDQPPTLHEARDETESLEERGVLSCGRLRDHLLEFVAFGWHTVSVGVEGDGPRQAVREVGFGNSVTKLLGIDRQRAILLRLGCGGKGIEQDRCGIRILRHERGGGGLLAVYHLEGPRGSLRVG